MSRRRHKGCQESSSSREAAADLYLALAEVNICTKQGTSLSVYTLIFVNLFIIKISP